jgi:hypothetical protein
LPQTTRLGQILIGLRPTTFAFPLGKALYDKRSPHFAESIRRIIHSMNWKDYEKEIYQQFKDMYPTAEITYDAKVLGRYSKVDR